MGRVGRIGRVGSWIHCCVLLVGCEENPQGSGGSTGGTTGAETTTGGTTTTTTPGVPTSGPPDVGMFETATTSTAGTSVGSNTDSGSGVRPGDHTRDVPGFADRAYVLYVPPNMNVPAPVVLVLHGGGGNPDSMRQLICPLGDTSSPRCMEGVADEHGFAVVYPSGTSGLNNPELRTWNAGGGDDTWQCVSGFACLTGVDDIAYFDALLDDLAGFIDVDPQRVFASGMSNGAAMSHRLACERADRIAAIGPVAGGNQYATTQSCNPSRPVAVVAFHGLQDPCWAYDGGPAACAQNDGLSKVGIPTTMDQWAMRNGCGPDPTLEAWPDEDPDDGTVTEVQTWPRCDQGADVVLHASDGAGHTWPGGAPYARSAGLVVQDFDANERLWAFFAAHPMP